MTTSKTRKKKTRTSPREAIDDTLNRLEKDLSPNLARFVRQVRRQLREFEAQMDKARADSEKRWNRAETQLRRELANMLRKLEKAVEPPSKKKAATRKRTATKTGTSKKTVRKTQAA